MGNPEDPDFADVGPDKSPGGSRIVVRPRPPLVAWAAVYAVNLIIPLFFGFLVTRGGGRAGMLACTLLIFAAGCRICFASREAILTVVYGGWVVAASQLYPIPHVLVGGIAVGTATALGTVASQRADNVDTVLGGGVATLVTGGILLAVAAALGLPIRRIRARFTRPVAPGPASKSGKVQWWDSDDLV